MIMIDGNKEAKMEKKIDFRIIDYHTFKNRLMENYPESMIDIQLVYEGDEFSFKKENGKVIYNHIFNNPFSKDKKAVGGYCVIKNKLGEFIEIMNETEILKCKEVAKMKNIWNNWSDEMYLKTIMKRACKRFFHDITQDIDEEDNKNYDLTQLDKKPQNTPYEAFLKLIKNNPNEEKLKEEWILTENDIEAQRTLYKRVKENGK